MSALLDQLLTKTQRAECAASDAALTHSIRGALRLPVDPDLGAYRGHPMDPRTPDPDYPSMELDLGTGTATVVYEETSAGEAILGAVFVGGVEMEASDFSTAVQSLWRNAIERVLDRAREDAACAA
jgi:hypothetical protein